VVGVVAAAVDTSVAVMAAAISAAVVAVVISVAVMAAVITAVVISVVANSAAAMAAVISAAAASVGATNLRAAGSLVGAAVSTATLSARKEDGIALPVTAGAAGVAVGEVGVAGSDRCFGRFFWETCSRTHSGRMTMATRSGLTAPLSTMTTMDPIIRLTATASRPNIYGHTGGSGYRRFAIHANQNPPDVTQRCGGFAPGVTSFPIDPIRQAIHPTGEQITFLDDLADASSKASAILNASCPNEPPLTPLARLDAVERRLEATIRAIEIVRPPLANLYESLSDEQRQRLDAIGEREARYGSRTPATGSSRAATLSSLCGDQATSFTRLPVERIEEIVKPTGQQQSALEELKKASAEAAEELRASCPVQTAETPMARLDAMNSRMTTMVQAVKTLRPTLGSFYASLSDEQKAQFNNMGQQNASPPENATGGR
jgi:LTXXQ motif family protein